MSLQQRLDALKADFEGGKFPIKPTEAQLATMHKATAELIASGLADRALKAGDTAPHFVLNDADGAPVDSRDLLARGPLVLSFYRGVRCPYCNLDLQALEASRAAFEERGTGLVAISPQTPANSRKSQRQNELGFPILSGTDSEVAAAFGIRFALPDDLIALYKSFGNDLPAINANPPWVLPMPARYVVGTDSVIVYAEVNPDYTRRPDPSELLPVLDRLRAMRAA